jgi:hypothetical protein
MPFRPAIAPPIGPPGEPALARGAVLGIAAAALGAAAVGVAALTSAQPLLAFAPLVILGFAALCWRRPAAATVFAVGLSGTYGSIRAFTGLSAALPIDLILAGLWVGLVLTRIATRSREQNPLWPAFLVIVLYVAVSAIQIAFTTDPHAALFSFRLEGWYLLAIGLIAYAGWDTITYRRVARGVVLVAGFVGAYASLRFFIGPAAQERTLAINTGGAYNFVDGKLRDVGSFSGGHALSFWAGMTAPFCLAAALGWRGRWRLVAGAAFPVLVFAVLASKARGGFLGLLVGVVVVLVLYQLARAMPGLHLGSTTLVLVTAAAIVGGGLAFVAGSAGQLGRYTHIFSCQREISCVYRTEKWDEAMPGIERNLFGHGIGTASADPALRGPAELTPAVYNLDNSYLKIAWEQGIPVLALFVAGIGLLLARLSWGATRVRDREAAAMGIGAAGTLASGLACFYAEMFVENIQVVGMWVIVGLGCAFVLSEERKQRAGRPARAR